MHVHFIVSRRALIDAHFPNMETVARSNLYFDGTRVYTVVARSFAAFGGSYAPDIRLSLELCCTCTLYMYMTGALFIGKPKCPHIVSGHTM